MDVTNETNDTVSLPQPDPQSSPTLPASDAAVAQASSNGSASNPSQYMTDVVEQAIAPLTTPPSAVINDDDEAIERAWIDKTKQIIASTREDPYEQSKQLAALKAEYLQKRYNKTINVSM